MRVRSLLCLAVLVGCGETESLPGPFGLSDPQLPTSLSFEGCVYASPLVVGDDLVVYGGDGRIVRFAAGSQTQRWSTLLPTPEGEDPVLVATPVRVGNRLVAVYHTAAAPAGAPAGVPRGHNTTERRLRHRMAVLDLETGALDPDFPPFDLAAVMPGNGGEVPFRPANAMARGNLVHTPSTGPLGRVFVSFGNVRDIQPWHGWLFAVDLDAWGAQEDPIHNVFLTTPEPDCGPTGASGSRDRICGGGLWAPGGPWIQEDPFELVIAPGNGQLDLSRRDYANTLLKLDAELRFESGCDAALCANTDPTNPSQACIESCPNMFVPRLLPGQALPPQCGNLSMFECWADLDYIGGSTPVEVRSGDLRGYAYPAKDGAVYLVDAEHLGRMWDREVLVEVCGSQGDTCQADWAGMIVTKPTDVDGRLIVPTFMPDTRNSAGVVALDVVQTQNGLDLVQAWTYPEFDTEEARSRFRTHPSRASRIPGRDAVAVVEVRRQSTGRLLILDTNTGQRRAEGELAGPGQRYVAPAVVGDTVFVASCTSDAGPGWLEAFDLQN